MFGEYIGISRGRGLVQVLVISSIVCCCLAGCGTEPVEVGINAKITLTRMRDHASAISPLQDIARVDIQTVADPDSFDGSLYSITADNVLLDSAQLPLKEEQGDVFYSKSAPADSLGFLFAGDHHTVSVNGARDYPGFTGNVRLPKEPAMQSPVHNASVSRSSDLSIIWNPDVAGNYIQVRVYDNGLRVPLLETVRMPDSGKFVVPHDILTAAGNNIDIELARSQYIRRDLGDYHSYTIEAIATEKIHLTVTP